VEQFFTTSNLCLLNDKTPTYCHPATGTLTSIDLSILSPSIFQDFNWEVLPDPMGSDHHPIILKSTDTSPAPTADRWAFRKADWTKFQNLCNTTFDRQAILQSPDPIQEFTNSLINAAHQSIPTSNGTNKNPPKPWFNADCKRAIAIRRRAYRRVHSNPSSSNITNYRLAKAQARNVTRENKRKSWAEYVTKLNSRTPSRKVWKMIRKISGKKAPLPRSHLQQGNNLITDDQKIANTLAQNFASNSSSAHYTPEFQNYKQAAETGIIDFTSNNDEAYNSPFTMTELISTIQQSHDSAVGPDMLHYQMLKHLPDNTCQLLLDTINSIWTTDSFPIHWREATILPFPKPGKPTTDPSSYRPIALTSCLCKTMERMINSRLIWHLDTNNSINIFQSGFRKNRSTNDHLVRLETYIREAFVQKQHVLAVFFDLEKAYDTTWRHGSIIDLNQAGLKGHLPKFISHFLTDRTFRVKTNTSLSNWNIQEMGVPQGSVLSVTLFCMRINHIIQNLTPGVQCGLYVDDFAIYIRSTSITDAEKAIQKTIDNLQQWCNCNGFKFSPTKTQCILFRRPRAKPNNPTLLLNGTIIPVTTEVKFLGVIFDHKMSFIPHIINLKTKCLKALNIIKVVSHQNWGGDQQTLLNLYRATIRSKLDYGSFIYGSARTTYINMLNPVVNQALRLCLGAFRTSPEASLHIEAREIPIALRRTKLALQFTTKLASNPSHPAYPAIFHPTLNTKFVAVPRTIPPLSIRLTSALQDILPDPSVIVQIKPYPIPPWHLKLPTVILDLHTLPNKDTTSPAIYHSRFLETASLYPHHTAIYTDGSKAGTRVGAAAVIPPHTLLQRLPDRSSIFTAELRAIQMALSHIITYPPKDYIIYSDSLSVLKALTTPNTNNPLIMDTLIQLHNIGNQSNVALCWVPSHIGIQGNETADQAAKAALYLPASHLLTLATDLRPSIDKWTLDNWQLIWDSRPQSKLHQIQPNVSIHTKPKHKSLSRRDEIIISRLRIGHTRLTHSHLLEGGPPPICIPCNQPLTIQHILIECIDFQNTRTKHYTSTNIEELLSATHPSAILNFLKEIRLYSKI